MSFFLEEIIRTTKFRTFCKYKDLPDPLRGGLSELVDEADNDCTIFEVEQTYPSLEIVYIR